MVKKANGIAKATPSSAGTGAGAAAGPSKASPFAPGSIRTSRFKKRRVKVNREKAAAAAASTEEVPSVGAGTAGGDASAAVAQTATVAEASPVTQTLESATVAEASPVAQTPKQATVAEALPMAQTPKPKPIPKPADADATAAAAAATSKGKGVGVDNKGGDGRIKSRKERAKERAMKGKEVEEDGGNKRKGKKAVGKKEEKVDNKGAGFIFMCNAQTKQECYQNRLFGLPHGKMGMVKKIRPGAKLFLYDFDLKLLYGVYKAASNGGLDLVREAFNGKFPAQVKFKIEKDCLPLPESSLKQAIKENYIARSKFNPELNARQVHRLIGLFKPAYVPKSAPNNRLEERRQYEEQRRPYHFEERRPSLPIDEVHRARFDEERRPAVIHVPALNDPYRAPRYAPLPVESQLGHSLANDHHIYYQPPLAPEPRQIPLALEARHVPLALERHHVPSVPEPRHVPAAYYHTLVPSDDSYYRSAVDLVPERYADRTVSEITARDPIIPRDHTRLQGEISVRMDHLEELYQTGGIASRVSRVEEPYRPGELAARADRLGIAVRADRLEELYRSDLVTHAVDRPRHSNPAYAETSQRPISARANAPGVPVSSHYSFGGGPVYR